MVDEGIEVTIIYDEINVYFSNENLSNRVADRRFGKTGKLTEQTLYSSSAFCENFQYYRFSLRRFLSGRGSSVEGRVKINTQIEQIKFQFKLHVLGNIRSKYCLCKLYKLKFHMNS